MKQKTETKLRIEFNLDIENRPLKEDISKNSIGLSAFREQPQIRNPTKVSERCGPNRQECDFSSSD